MKTIPYLLLVFFFCSCWKPYRNQPEPALQQKVWGSKPIYAAIVQAKKVEMLSGKQPLIQPGNIYAYKNLVFQIDIGRGIHIIDNTVPADADRIGYITMNGCSQISIKGAYLYTNSYGDLVTIDLSNSSDLREVSRLPNAFPELTFQYPLAMPEEQGFYECPRMDSVVIGWTKDSIMANCFKN
ncbi:MAG: hypothetical protein V4725_04525 [Bacteroidota bacterium]|nr:hypothetical protein [Ferruginibacter sp.]